MKKTNLLISQLFDLVYDALWDSERFHKSGHAKIVKFNYQKHILPSLGTYDVRLLTRKRIKLWHQKMAAHPVTANRCLSILSRMYSFAIDMEWIDSSPCINIKTHKERKRSRYASEEEIKKLCEALEKHREKAPITVAYLFTILFTGSRPKALGRLLWEDLKEGQSGISTITFDGKTTSDTGEKETLVIPSHIVDMWKTLPQRKDGLIFGQVEYRYLWKKIQKEVGCKDLWARDLRRTFATIGMSNGVKMDTISELLNHQSVQTTKIYAKLNSTARVEAATIISNKIKGLI